MIIGRAGYPFPAMGAAESVPTFKTIKEIRTYTAELGAAIDQLNRDAVKVIGAGSPDWYNVFRAWRARWQAARVTFDKSGAGLTGFDVWEASRTMDAIKKWRADYDAYRAKLTAPAASGGHGVKASGIAPRFGQDAPAAPWYSDLPWLKIGIGAAALFAFWPLISGARAGASILGSRMRSNPKRRDGLTTSEGTALAFMRRGAKGVPMIAARTGMTYEAVRRALEGLAAKGRHP